MMLPALSIRQPWAGLILRGDKTVENRTKRFKHRGPLLVHASRTYDASGDDLIREALPDVQLHGPEFQMCGIVGVVDISGCDLYQETIHGGDVWSFGPYMLLIKRAQVVKFQPLHGLLGIFSVEYPHDDSLPEWAKSLRLPEY